jgi:hypothetical protein
MMDVVIILLNILAFKEDGLLKLLEFRPMGCWLFEVCV